MLPSKRGRATAEIPRWLGGRDESGMTIIEVLTAIFILSLTVTAVMRLISAADVLRARAVHLTQASLLAHNEAEHITQTARYYQDFTDTSYVETVNGVDYEIERVVIPFDGYPVQQEFASREIEIHVGLAAREDTLVSFRFLQGYEK